MYSYSSYEKKIYITGMDKLLRYYKLDKFIKCTYLLFINL